MGARERAYRDAVRYSERCASRVGMAIEAGKRAKYRVAVERYRLAVRAESDARARFLRYG